MINVARQAFANPFLSATGASFQPGAAGSVARCPVCGNAVSGVSTIQPQTMGFNPMSVGAGFGQQLGGQIPNPYAFSQTGGFGQTNPLAQLQTSVPSSINPLGGQLAANWPISSQLHQGTSRSGAFGIDPRVAFGVGGQQFGYSDPNVVPGLTNPALAGDPINSLWAQHLGAMAQQQLPIRPLIGNQGLGSQSLIPGLNQPITQLGDPYRAFIEAQLLSQLANNPFYHLQRAYGGFPEAGGFGTPFGTGQQFNPLFGNIPF